MKPTKDARCPFVFWPSGLALTATPICRTSPFTSPYLFYLSCFWRTESVNLNTSHDLNMSDYKKKGGGVEVNEGWGVVAMAPPFTDL